MFRVSGLEVIPSLRGVASIGNSDLIQVPGRNARPGLELRALSLSQACVIGFKPLSHCWQRAAGLVVIA